MHGRPREYKNKLKADSKAQEAYKKKVDAIRNGTALVLEYRKQKKYDPAVLDAAAKLLKVVPEIYTLWNYRREALGPVFESGGEQAQRASEGELALTQACLLENPKSYSTWHHRKWVVGRGLAPLERELHLVSRPLGPPTTIHHNTLHVLSRPYAVRRTSQDELQYVEDKILQNFSNYSAWHFRTILLHQMYCSGPAGSGSDSGSGNGGDAAAGSLGSTAPLAAAATAGGSANRGSAGQRTPIPHDVLDQEYDMVHQAFATDSRDESPWMYYRWLACRLLEDHLAAEPDARWPLLTLARLREAQARLGLGGSPEECEEMLQEARSLYGRLMILDPMRRGFYEDALEGRAFVVVQALGTV
ncbi:hypothetical protein VOLCADRAFT_117940 [Volvox carteri f. nagariensis]|uniref:Geranylgeranyl transferase type-2 subunit alpha n=1 Tax=Volvox carteri f. nagariensis TaxID=3068 RepID=D8TZD4_VOLCA|nr:uncharacterized protein VOLCADRAFT_117940 [Volvox carteri f. nagariensis]EFJ47256.1 hypothetical protein VOLCADRAFT_117940 [Volvox carteri f. nagariensis]|eukprot:XP_002951805.1 hypothetical protein VOLCADRAFT_117940 [Volvox carteri f. nagariensis]